MEMLPSEGRLSRSLTVFPSHTVTRQLTAVADMVPVSSTFTALALGVSLYRMPFSPCICLAKVNTSWRVYSVPPYFPLRVMFTGIVFGAEEVTAVTVTVPAVRSVLTVTPEGAVAVREVREILEVPTHMETLHPTGSPYRYPPSLSQAMLSISLSMSAMTGLLPSRSTGMVSVSIITPS